MFSPILTSTPMPTSEECDALMEQGRIIANEYKEEKSTKEEYAQIALPKGTLLIGRNKGENILGFFNARTVDYERDSTCVRYGGCTITTTLPGVVAKGKVIENIRVDYEEGTIQITIDREDGEEIGVCSGLNYCILGGKP